MIFLKKYHMNLLINIKIHYLKFHLKYHIELDLPQYLYNLCDENVSLEKCLKYAIINQDSESIEFIFDIFNRQDSCNFNIYEDIYEILLEKNIIQNINILGFLIENFPKNINHIINQFIVEFFSIETVKYIIEELKYKINPLEINVSVNGYDFNGYDFNGIIYDLFDYLFYFNNNDLIKYFQEIGILDFRSYDLNKGMQLYMESINNDDFTKFRDLSLWISEIGFGYYTPSNFNNYFMSL